MQSGKKTRKWLAVLAAVILAAGVLGALIYRMTVRQRLEGYRLITDFAGRNHTEMEISVDAQWEQTPVAGKIAVFRSRTEDGITWGFLPEEQRLYLREDVFYLENGMAFRVSVSLPEWESTLEHIGLLFSTGKITPQEDGGEICYHAEAGVEQAKSILSVLAPEVAEKVSAVEGLGVTLTSREDRLTGLKVEANGERFRLNLGIQVLESGTLDTRIPQAVLDAEKSPGEIITLRWDPNALPLFRSAAALAERDRFQAELEVRIDCASLTLSEKLTLEYDATGSIPVGCLRKGDAAVYFSGSAMCTAGGTLITEYDEIGYSSLLLLAVPLLEDGRMVSLRQGDSGRYTMALTSEELETVEQSIAAKAKGLDIRLEEGSLEADVSSNWLDGVKISCSGSFPFFATRLPVTVELTASPSQTDSAPEIPQAVRDALSGEPSISK